MFLKLWKYEIKCSYRTYLLMYVVLLLLPLFINAKIQMLSTISAILYAVMIIITLVMTFVLVIRNYTQSMFSRAGYLTMTLPISAKKVLLVKILNATLWFILSYVVIAVSVLLLSMRLGSFTLGEVLNVFSQAIGSMELEGWVALLEFTVAMLQMVTMIYMILNITHTNYIRKHRTLIGIIIFILLEILLSYVNSILFQGDSNSLIFSFMFSTGSTDMLSNTGLITSSIYTMLIEDTILLLVFYFGASYLLDHKLELE